MKASDLFVKALENEGVEYIFSVPGEENLDFLESLRTSRICRISDTAYAPTVLDRTADGVGSIPYSMHEMTFGKMTVTKSPITRRAGAEAGQEFLPCHPIST